MQFLETKRSVPMLALLFGAAMKWFALTHPEGIGPSELHRLGGIALAQLSGLIALAAFVAMRRAGTAITRLRRRAPGAG